MTRGDDPFHWRVEEACLNAWPALRQVSFGGWLLRISGGPSRRINSINPIAADVVDPLHLMQAAQAIYGGAGQAILFRVPSILDGIEATLAQLGFLAEGETLTLYRDLDQASRTEVAEVRLTPEADAVWLEARARLALSSLAAQQVDRAIVANLLIPHAFAAARDAERIVSIAFGAIHRGLLVLEAVATDPGHRGRGHARRVVAALNDWGLANGASGACLQVLADNEAAKALYRSQGFDRTLYRYRYHRQHRMA